MILREIVMNFLNETADGVATMKQICQAVKESNYETRGKTLDCSTRAVVYRSKEIKRLAKGIYCIVGEKTSSLLINGDSRSLSEIEDASVDCIITDHPWQDKKAHTSGNQKGFAEYETFCYTQDDFNAKARVLKEGSYLCEFLPVESATNWKYISSLKEMAEKAGLDYYCSCIWRKAPEGTINNGRTTKGVEQLILFTKGKPRRLAPKGKPYMTRNMLSYEIDIPIKAKEKHHQAEKPLSLYEYLIENLTEEEDVCLDQFGGACNMLQASVNKNRFAVVYELGKQFVHNAVERFHCMTLFTEEQVEEEKEESIENAVPEEVIPAETIMFQKRFLERLFHSNRKDLLSEVEWNEFFSETVSEKTVNALFERANRLGYAEYQKPTFEMDFETYAKLQPVYKAIDEAFNQRYDRYVRAYYENVRIENECFAEYKAKHSGGIREYIQFIKDKFPKVNIQRTERILTNELLFTY